MRTQVTLAVLALVGTISVRAGFMSVSKKTATASGMFDEDQMQYIDGVAVIPISNETATSITYYDWEHQMDWSGMGVYNYTYVQKYPCGGGYYASECPQQRYYRPCTPYCFPYCAPTCQYYVPTCTSVQNCTMPPAPVPPPSNATVEPEIPPSGNTTQNITIVEVNCTMFKSCRERPRSCDQGWWDYWNIDQSSSSAAMTPYDAAMSGMVIAYPGMNPTCGGFQCGSCGMCAGNCMPQCYSCCGMK